MKKTIIILLVTWLFAVGWDISHASNLKVIQDKDGKITITDEYVQIRKGKRTRSSTSGNVTYYSESSKKHTIPAKYYSKIKLLAIKYDISESIIISVARAESGFNTFAVSHKGAVGIMQLMVGTALMYGVINRYNADQNLEAGVKHLKYLYEKYNHNLSLTLAAYNAGEEAVKKYNGIPPYRETRDYVKRIMGYMGMPINLSSRVETRMVTRIYQYRSPDGKITITDSFPLNATGEVIVLE